MKSGDFAASLQAFPYPQGARHIRKAAKPPTAMLLRGSCRRRRLMRCCRRHSFETPHPSRLCRATFPSRGRLVEFVRGIGGVEDVARLRNGNGKRGVGDVARLRNGNGKRGVEDVAPYDVDLRKSKKGGKSNEQKGAYRYEWRCGQFGGGG